MSDIKLNLKTEKLMLRHKFILIGIFLFFTSFSNDKNIIIFYLIFFSLIFYYRYLVLRALKKHTKITINDGYIDFNSHFMKKKIYFKDMKNITYIENRENIGDIVINIVPGIFVYKYIFSLFKENYGFSNTLKYKTFLIPDVVNLKEVFGEIERKKIGDKKEEFKIINSENLKFEIGEKIMSSTDFKRKSKIVFFEGAKYDSEKRKIIHPSQMGMVPLQYRGIRLPSLKLK